jgi:predicted DNA-binding protein
MRRMPNIPENPTSVKIPDELKQRAKLVEQRTGATLSAIVRVALSRYVDDVLAKEEKVA